MRHIDTRYGIGDEYTQKRAGFEVEQAFSCAQNGQWALLPHDIENDLGRSGVIVSRFHIMPAHSLLLRARMMAAIARTVTSGVVSLTVGSRAGHKNI